MQNAAVCCRCMLSVVLYLHTLDRGREPDRKPGEPMNDCIVALRPFSGNFWVKKMQNISYIQTNLE